MNTLYKVVKIEGKDLGCVAIKDIKKGTLILQEEPQCFANATGPSQIGNVQLLIHFMTVLYTRWRFLTLFMFPLLISAVCLHHIFRRHLAAIFGFIKTKVDLSL